jgi:hypothetical protein
MDMRTIDNRLDLAVSRALRQLGEVESLLHETLGKSLNGRDADLVQQISSRLLYLYSWTRDVEKASLILKKWQRKLPNSAIPIVEGARFYFRCGHPEKALRALEQLNEIKMATRKDREVRTYFSGLHLRGFLQLYSGKDVAATRTLRTILKFAANHLAEIGSSFELDFVEALGKRNLANSEILRYLDLTKWTEFDAPVFEARAKKLRRRVTSRLHQS